MYFVNGVPASAWGLADNDPQLHMTSQRPPLVALDFGHVKKKYQLYFYDKAGGNAQSHAFNDVTGVKTRMDGLFCVVVLTTDWTTDDRR